MILIKVMLKDSAAAKANTGNKNREKGIRKCNQVALLIIYLKVSFSDQFMVIFN